MKNKPYLLNLRKIGHKDSGYISLLEGNNLLPFKAKRIYWIYETPNGIDRGGHYHEDLKQIIICLRGKLTFRLENIKGVVNEFILDNPSKALFIPPKYWRDIKFENSAILFCIASEVYDENDYVRDYQKFKNLY